MSEQRGSRRPTDAELEILQVVWELGAGSVRDVHARLEQEKVVGLTTVLKLMQIMVEKGLLVRDATTRPQVYRPARARRQTQAQFLRHVVDRVFGGSPGALALQALSSRPTTPEERRQIRELLDRLEREERER